MEKETFPLLTLIYLNHHSQRKIATLFHKNMSREKDTNLPPLARGTPMGPLTLLKKGLNMPRLIRKEKSKRGKNFLDLNRVHLVFLVSKFLNHIYILIRSDYYILLLSKIECLFYGTNLFLWYK